jgi:hypothetical protein
MRHPPHSIRLQNLQKADDPIVFNVKCGEGLIQTNSSMGYKRIEHA